MREKTFLQTQIYTRFSELPLVEIHKILCKPSQAEIHFSTCGNPHKIVYLHMQKYTQNCEFPNVLNAHFSQISTWGKSSGTVYFMQIYKLISEFPQANICWNTCLYGNFHMQKYTGKCEFVHVEIHVERCITACGNTLNPVQKNSSITSDI